MGWVEYILALAAFFLSHSFPLRPAFRSRLVTRLGARGFAMVYSALSLAVLAWVIGAAGRAPYLPLWEPAPWQNWVTLAAMLAVCLIAALALGRPNPFSFGGARTAEFAPARPGLVRWMRHPLLVALAGWALAHLVANGDLAHVVLFGLFASFALLGQRLVDRRRRAALGSEWERLNRAVQAHPQPSVPFKGPEIVIRSAIGVAVYAALLAVHPILFGVSPLT